MERHLQETQTKLAVILTIAKYLQNIEQNWLLWRLDLSHRAEIRIGVLRSDGRNIGEKENEENVRGR